MSRSFTSLAILCALSSAAFAGGKAATRPRMQGTQHRTELQLRQSSGADQDNKSVSREKTIRDEGLSRTDRGNRVASRQKEIKDEGLSKTHRGNKVSSREKEIKDEGLSKTHRGNGVASREKEIKDRGVGQTSGGTMSTRQQVIRHKGTGTTQQTESKPTQR